MPEHPALCVTFASSSSDTGQRLPPSNISLATTTKLEKGVTVQRYGFRFAPVNLNHAGVWTCSVGEMGQVQITVSI